MSAKAMRGILAASGMTHAALAERLETSRPRLTSYASGTMTPSADMFIDALLISEPTRVAGTAVFMTSRNDRVPNAMLHNLMHNKVLHERVLIVSVEVFDVPYVPEIDRVEITRLKGEFYKVTVQYGFKDEPDIPLALTQCAVQGLNVDMMETSFFLGRATLVPKVGSEMALWREKLFVLLYRNAGSATSFYKIPTNRVVELGTQVVL